MSVAVRVREQAFRPRFHEEYKVTDNGIIRHSNTHDRIRSRKQARQMRKGIVRVKAAEDIGKGTRVSLLKPDHCRR
jgi:hypothetical protein